MALVSKAKAARLAGCSRTTIHRYINEGRLSESDGKIDTSELMRVFGAISEQDSTQSSERSSGQPVTPQSTPQNDPLVQQLLAEKDKRIEALEKERDRAIEEAQHIKLLTDQNGGKHQEEVRRLKEEERQRQDKQEERIKELTNQLVNQNKGPQPAQVLIAMGMLAVLIAVVFLAMTAG